MEAEKIRNAEQILIDNGLKSDEARTVRQAIGCALLDKNIYEPKYQARCIQWDLTDDNGKPIKPSIDLPSEVTVTFEDLNLPDNATDEDIEDKLAEYLTENYGFCHNGFFFEKIDAWSD